MGETMKTDKETPISESVLDARCGEMTPQEQEEKLISEVKQQMPNREFEGVFKSGSLIYFVFYGAEYGTWKDEKIRAIAEKYGYDYAFDVGAENKDKVRIVLVFDKKPNVR
jgi:vacuolar-type H+-ATPase subunit I/STV1